MRNVFYFLAALLAFGAAYYYYQDVSAQTATIQKLRLDVRDGEVIAAGTIVDEEFIEDYIVSQSIPRTLAGEFSWALDDTPAVRVNLRDRVFGQDVTTGSFLQRSHFFVSQEDQFARRIKEGYRAFSIPLEKSRAVETFLAPGSRVDVIGAFAGRGDTIVSRRLLENVEVMGVGGIDNLGDIPNSERDEYRSVTLQATAAETERFLAESVMAIDDLTLVMRNPCEDSEACVGGVEATQ